MNLLDKWDIIKNRKRSNLRPGYVDTIFEIHENNSKDESGQLPIIVKIEAEEKKEKKRRIIN